MYYQHREYFTNTDGITIAVRAFSAQSSIMHVTACIEGGKACKYSDEYRQDVDYFTRTHWEHLPERLTPISGWSRIIA